MWLGRRSRRTWQMHYRNAGETAICHHLPCHALVTCFWRCIRPSSRVFTAKVIFLGDKAGHQSPMSSSIKSDSQSSEVSQKPAIYKWPPRVCMFSQVLLGCCLFSFLTFLGESLVGVRQHLPNHTKRSCQECHDCKAETHNRSSAVGSEQPLLAGTEKQRKSAPCRTTSSQESRIAQHSPTDAFACQDA